MKVAIFQPGYLPWLGFFDQMNAVDAFILLDDVQYSKNSWRNRNRVLGKEGVAWLTVPILSSGKSRQRIDEVLIDSRASWRRKHWGTLEQFYAKAPHFDRYRDELRSLYEQPWERLCDLDRGLIEWICEKLGLARPLHWSSSLGVTDQDPNMRLVRICQRVGADGLYEGQSGSGYLDQGLLRDHGIAVEFQEYDHPIYPQIRGRSEFVSYLSIVDLLFNCGPDSLDVLTGKRVAAVPTGTTVVRADDAFRTKSSAPATSFAADGRPAGTLLTPMLWDTQFFGFPIVRLEPAKPVEEGLRRGRDEALRIGARCIFAEVSGGADMLPDLPLQHGYALVEISAWLRARHPSQELLNAETATVRPGLPSDIDHLGPAIDRLAPWSRFASDPRFGTAVARDVYLHWVKSSAEDDTGLFLVAEEGGEIAGFMTCEESSRMRICLIAANEGGRGVGTALAKAAFVWADSVNEDLWVKTSLRNTAALRFYERSGFRIEDVTYSYHLWTDTIESA